MALEEQAKDLLKSLPTAFLIEALASRHLSDQEVARLHKLQAATDTRVSTGTVVDTKDFDVSENINKLVKTVLRRNVQGKLPVGSIINGRPIQVNLAGGFYDHGDIIKYGKQEQLVGSLVSSIYNRQDDFPEVMQSHFVAITQPVDNPSSSVMTIYFFQDRKQIDSRGWFTPAHVQTELPKSAMEELLTEIQRNPDSLEDFYQKVFPGLDSQDEKPGMRRAKADGFYLITGSNLEKAGSLGAEYGWGLGRNLDVFLREIGKNEYRHGPYGTGNIFTKR